LDLSMQNKSLYCSSGRKRLYNHSFFQTLKKDKVL